MDSGSSRQRRSSLAGSSRQRRSSLASSSEQSLHNAFASIHHDHNASFNNSFRSAVGGRQRSHRSNGKKAMHRRRSFVAGGEEGTPSSPRAPRRRATIDSPPSKLPPPPFKNEMRDRPSHEWHLRKQHSAEEQHAKKTVHRRYSPQSPIEAEESESKRELTGSPTQRVTKKHQAPPARRHSEADKPSSFTVKHAQQFKSSRRQSVTFGGTVTPIQHHVGLRHDYKLGDTIRSPAHLVPITSPEVALQAVGTLDKHDFAWVKRSNGTYSYAIVAYKSCVPARRTQDIPQDDSNCVMEECLTFVINQDGYTKMIRKSCWAKYVRLVATSTEEEIDESFKQSSDNAMYCQEIPFKPLDEQLQEGFTQEKKHAHCQEVEHHDDVLPFPFPNDKEQGSEEEGDFVPPNMITFDAKEVADEECSLLSSVSYKARLSRSSRR